MVVEDSRIGMLAARAAGMRCLVTTSSYTAAEPELTPKPNLLT